MSLQSHEGLKIIEFRILFKDEKTEIDIQEMNSSLVTNADSPLQAVNFQRCERASICQLLYCTFQGTVL